MDSRAPDIERHCRTTGAYSDDLLDPQKAYIVDLQCPFISSPLLFSFLFLSRCLLSLFLSWAVVSLVSRLHHLPLR